MSLNAYPRKTFDLLDVVLEYRWLLPVVKSIELRDVVHLDIVLDPIAKSGSRVS